MRRLLAILLATIVLLTAVSRAHAAPISYIYDALGRLIAVIDHTGDTAIYAYDAVGNLLAISRHASTTTAIIHVRPGKGIVGDTVTIEGSGFSATPAENTVNFNGTAATVVSSSLTEIVTSVPAGATTGTISVTTPTGSANSPSPFVVLAATEAPTITGFTPTIGKAGDAVTINGTNFETVPTNNKVAFNVPRGRPLITSSTASAIQASVPHTGTSGRITVATPAGSATSVDDFFVPPPPYTAADVVATGRITVNGPTLSFGVPANKIALAVFDGVVGQRLSLGRTNGMGNIDLVIARPDGTLLASLLDNPHDPVHLPPLPVAGTYGVLVDPRPVAGGTSVFTLSEEVTGTIAVGGAAVPVSLPRVGQRARLTLEATAGQRLNLGLTSMTAPYLQFTFLKPDGSTLSGPVLKHTSQTPSAVDTPAVPVTGTYTLLVETFQGYTGNVTLTLSEEITGTIEVNGAAVTVTIARLGQQARYTFAGTAGQRVSLGVNAVTLQLSTATILKPDGTSLQAATIDKNWPPGWDLNPPPLPTTGTYAIVVDPWNVNTGALTLTLSEEINGGTITLGGTPVAVSISRVGQRARLSFSATVGQRVSLETSASTIGSGVYYIINPDWAALLSPVTGFGTGASFMEPVATVQEGVHTILIDPGATYSGNVTVKANLVPPDVTGTMTINGPVVPITITAAGQKAELTFTATAGQAFTTRMANSTIGCLEYALLMPNGSSTSQWPVCGPANTLSRTAPITGTYKVRVDPGGTGTGSADLSVTAP